MNLVDDKQCVPFVDAIGDPSASRTRRAVEHICIAAQTE
jgi:hypothetical protein